MLELVAAFICLTSLLTYVNFRFIGLPPTIGVMVTALMFSLLLQGLSFLGYPGLEERVQELIGQIDFGDLLMNWMLSFLLFAGALHVNFNDVRSYRWPIGLLATVGVIVDEQADHGEVMGEAGCLGLQPHVEELQLEAVLAVGLIEVFLVVALGTENGDSHGALSADNDVVKLQQIVTVITG